MEKRKQIGLMIIGFKSLQANNATAELLRSTPVNNYASYYYSLAWHDGITLPLLLFFSLSFRKIDSISLLSLSSPPSLPHLVC
jgi:hypothetical protein